MNPEMDPTADMEQEQMEKVLRDIKKEVMEPESSTPEFKIPAPVPVVETRKVILNLKPQDIAKVERSKDYRSRIGQFGWATIGPVHIPYIFREESNCFVAVRIVNQNLLPRFFNAFSQQLFDMFELPAFTITETERRLYNEINFNHCNSVFGVNGFQRSEQLLCLDDVVRFFDFFNHLYNRVILHTKVLHTTYGFMTFDNYNNLVPYYRLSGEPCFPVLYFEGDEKFLTDKSFLIPTFAESTLRVLMKLQNILVSIGPLRVITLTDLKYYYQHSSAVFVECWIPKENNLFTKTNKSELSVLNISCEDRNNKHTKPSNLQLPVVTQT